MRSILVLVVFFTFSSSADSAVDWSVDDSTLPEFLPDLMRNAFYSDEEIKKAVFWASKIQYDVISVHNGHVFDAETPLGYFNDGLVIPKTRASAINSDIIFDNNTVSGLTNFKSNKILIKWSQDQVSTEVIWKEIDIIGKYTYIDDLRYVNGEYHIFVEDFKYQAITSLSKNTELYLSSALNAATSYNKFKTIFTGDHSIPDEFSATKYFLEEVALRHVADHAAHATRQNVTSAIRAAVQPYVLYKNRSDPHFPGAAGRLDDGRGFAVQQPFTSGLDRAVQKVKAVWTDPGADATIVAVENTLHDLSGTFDLRVLQETVAGRGGDGGSNDVRMNDNVTGTPLASFTAAVDFTVDRVRLNVAYDVARPRCYCTAAVQMDGLTARSRNGGAGADEAQHSGPVQQAAAAFFRTVKDHLSVATCAAIAKTNRRGDRAPFCPSPWPLAQRPTTDPTMT